MRYLVQNNPHEISFFESKIILVNSIVSAMNKLDEPAKSSVLHNVKLYQEVEENKFVLVPEWQFPELFAGTQLTVKRS